MKNIIKLTIFSYILILSNSFAKEYNIRQIADPYLVNREPIISDSGLIAWHSFSHLDDVNSVSKIHTYHNGVTNEISQDLNDRYAGNFRAKVWSNTVIWTSSLKPPISEGYHTWVLKEPPIKEDEPIQYDANFKVSCSIGAGGSVKINEQVFEGTTNSPPQSEEEASLSGYRPVRYPSGDNEIISWELDQTNLTRVTHDVRNDVAPSLWGDIIVWQKAKGWPFGWEIMMLRGNERSQLTTNFYYDMAPKVHKNQITWYGWDGNDYEIYFLDLDKKDGIQQITDNQYDDVEPEIWDSVLVWEGFVSTEAEIFLWKDGEIKQISDNIDNDTKPSIWNGQVIWESFDGMDNEIYLYDGKETRALTNNEYEDVEPDFRDGVACWMGYYGKELSWDSEIFIWDGSKTKQLTDNEHEDIHPKTAGGRIVWITKHDNKSEVNVAEPK